MVHGLWAIVGTLDLNLSHLGKPREGRRVSRMAGKGSHKDCDRKGKNGLKPEPGASCCSGL